MKNRKVVPDFTMQVMLPTSNQNTLLRPNSFVNLLKKVFYQPKKPTHCIILEIRTS